MEEHLRQQATDIIKIVVFGPESTGKTTLSRDLSAYFNTVWIPEFARDYLQKKWDNKHEHCKEEDLLPIAIGQIKLENEALRKANKYLFCDTNLLTTKVYSELYYGHCEATLDKAARRHDYDLVFLTDIDVPWEKDNLRTNPNKRQKELKKSKEALIENKKPFIFLSGNKEERLKKAITIIKDFSKVKSLGFSSEDYVQMYRHGITAEKIEDHLRILEEGVIKIKLDKPAVVGDGILQLSGREIVFYTDYFDTKKTNYKIKKFVPASGAASRMFSFLSEFLNDFQLGKETINAYINRKKDTSLPVFLIGLDKLPFYKKVLTATKAVYPDYEKWTSDAKIFYFVQVLLSPRYFNYTDKPKGILPFHKYGNHLATPIEEHLKESVYYANLENISHLHFTVSEDHHEAFETILKTIKSKIEADAKVIFEIKFSYQKKETDTIAVTLKNKPLRDKKGKLVFRQSGHGALIENLKNLDADIIFIKNIDNIIHDHIKTITTYKKCLAGILIQLQEKIFQYITLLYSDNVAEEMIAEIASYAIDKLNIHIPNEFSMFTSENKINYLKEQLDRPIRVCGMVKNEGEPGGGPFWVRDASGHISLQIVETSQVDSNNYEQVNILEQATHFNPVDLVCGIKNSKGEIFDLDKFVDHNSGFIVQKNKDGKELKSYELPGLWNGAMSKWISVFVEVPLITFNPVKTVNDLLKAVHQPTS